MQQLLAIAAFGLQRMAEGMAEIEQRARPPVSRSSARHDPRPWRRRRRRRHGAGRRDRHPARRRHGPPASRRRAASPMQAVFHHLGIAGEQLAPRQGGRAHRDRPAPGAADGRLPTRFLPCGVLIPVLPPTELSTWASRVVGIWTKSMPRSRTLAAKPVRSPMTPPPSAISRLLRSIRCGQQTARRARPDGRNPWSARPAAG